MGKPGKSKQAPPSSEEESVEDIQQDEEQQSQSIIQHIPNQSQRQMQQKIVEEILEHAQKAQPNQKLTWYAIYSLKQKEMKLNDELNQQIDKIKEKYEMLKQPIYHQISQVSLGKQLAPQLYKPKGLQTDIDLKTIKPQKIESFWGIILDKQGLITQQVDQDCINKVTEFKCELLSHATNHLRITFIFGEETDYFFNKSLIAESRYDSDKNQPVREIKQEIKYKKDIVDHSLFTLLFDEKTDINHFYNVACELHQDYTNSLYYYFREEEQDLEGNEEDVQEIKQQDEQQEESEEEAPPTKKVKKEIEKPQCKNQ